MSVIAWRRVWLVLGCLCAVSALPVRAADPEAQSEPPKAADVLRAMSSYLAKAGPVSYHAEVEFDQILPGGPKIRLAGAVDVTAKRPGSLFVNYRDDVSERMVWFQDGRLILLDPVAATYAEVSGPKDIDGMVEKLEKEHGVALPLAELVESDPMAVLMRGVDFSHWVGIHDVDGVFCHHLVLQRPDLELQVFVEVGDKPLPRKLVFEYPLQPGSPQYTAWITEWSFAPPAANVFAAKLPEDVARVEFLPIGEAR
jgi:hypothetical protein